MLHRMPVILLATIILVVLLDPFIPLPAKQLLYAASLTIKSGIIFLLPMIIFGLLFKTMVTFSRGATALIFLILGCVCFSNVIATFLSHFVGEWIYQFDINLQMPENSAQLVPAWTFALPKLLSNDVAMFSGILLGLLFGKWRPAMAEQIATVLDKSISFLLTCICWMVPVFIAGFVMKLQYEGVVYTIIKDYALIFVLVAAAQFTYVLSLYAVFNGFRFSAFFACVKNILPAALAGASSMSSAAAMPLTIAGAERNATNKEVARSVIPATVNIHLLGDCFAIPIFAYAVMKSFGVPEPMLMNYLVFMMYFVIAKFSVAAIPGGGIMVMLPVLEATLHFNADMLSLITALYFLFDSVITCANVLGNGAFAKGIDRILAVRELTRAKLITT